MLSMSKKFLLLFVLSACVLNFPISLDAQERTMQPVPSKGQWAFALENSLPVYEQPDAKADAETVEFPESWLKLLGSRRDEEGSLWYKVKIGKKIGWLAQNGVLLKIGPKSKTASDLYDTYAKNTKKAKKNPELFASEDPAECKAFLGFNPLGMSEASIQKRLGTPTARYTDFIESQFTTFSYELPTKNITFDVCMQDGKVYAIELRSGRAGDIKLN